MATFQMPLIVEFFDYEIRTELDGVTFLVRFRWNWRADGGLGAWFMDLSDADGVLLVGGRKCIVDEFLLAQFRTRIEMPTGQMMPFDTTRRHIDPSAQDFGARVLLLYLDAGGLAEAVADT